MATRRFSLASSFASRGSPSTILSNASVKSAAVMFSRPSRVADSAASLTRLARSAPEKPGVLPATTSQVDVERQRFPLGVHVEDGLACGQLRPIDEDATIEAARAQQRRIEHVGTVGGRDDHHQVAALEAVHLRQQLVQRLLALVVAAAETRRRARDRRRRSRR